MNKGFTLIEALIVIAIVVIFLVILSENIPGCRLPFIEEKPYRNLSNSAKKLTCLDGHEYYLINSQNKIALSPKFDQDGNPSKCTSEVNQ